MEKTKRLIIEKYGVKQEVINDSIENYYHNRITDLIHAQNHGELDELIFDLKKDPFDNWWPHDDSTDKAVQSCTFENPALAEQEVYLVIENDVIEKHQKWVNKLTDTGWLKELIEKAEKQWKQKLFKEQKYQRPQEGQTENRLQKTVRISQGLYKPKKSGRRLRKVS